MKREQSLVRRWIRPLSLSRFAIPLITILAAAPGTAWAQTTGTTSTIDGIVRDTTGGVLPGVTVTITGAALISGQAEAVTNAEGAYRFRELPAGTYRIRFELAGFQTFVRDELQLRGGFAAKVDAELRVGSVSEEVTVTGASPIVDVSSTTSGQTLSTEVVNSVLPTSRTMSDVARLTPGVQSTNPPQPGFLGVATQGGYSAFGSTESTTMIDGTDARSGYTDISTAQEVDIKNFGNGADVPNVGTNINMILKSGGNTFHGRFADEYMNGRSGLQASNMDDVLRANGLTTLDTVKYFNSWDNSLGGRFIKDKLWFFGSFRQRNNKRTAAGFVANAGPDGTFGTGDEPPYFPSMRFRHYTGKLTYQMTQRYQLVASYASDRELADSELGNITGAIGFRYVPRESSMNEHFNPTTELGIFRATYSKVFFVAQVQKVWYLVDFYTPEEGLNTIMTRDITTLQRTGQSPDVVYRTRPSWRPQANLTYVPGGGHELKAGFRYYEDENSSNTLNLTKDGRDVNYTLVFDKGVPTQIDTYNRPIVQLNKHRLFGLFVSDRWAVNPQVTVNVGLRWDRDNSWVPPQTKIQGQFGNAADFPRVQGNSWQAFAPRAGAAFDLMGDGRTVLKTSYGWFNTEMSDGAANTFNKNSASTTTYRWTDPDGNRDYTPGEVDLSPSNVLSTTSAANNILNPDLKSPHWHEVAAALDRELMPNMAGHFVYVYRRRVGASESINILRPYSAYSLPYTRRDPGPDGVLDTPDDAGTVTIYDYTAAYRGAAFVGNQLQNRPDDRADFFHSFDFALEKRSTGKWGALVSTGVVMNHRQVGIVQSPNDEYFNLDETKNPYFKINGNYVLPWDIRTSAVWELQPGIKGQRTTVYRAADPDGGPSFTQQTTITVRSEPFGATRGRVRSIANFRVAKLFNVRSARMQVQMDVFNILNSNVEWAANYQSGPTFRNFTRINSPRIAQFGVSYEF
jgi:hypothetical protein